MNRRALNRATLARQMLLARERVKPLAAIERLAGLQAQVPRPPFIALWSRLENFRREDLLRLIANRRVVRGPLMRATIHLVSRKDFIAWRRVVQPALSRSANSIARGHRDFETLVNHARRHFDDAPCTFDDFRKSLQALELEGDIRQMAYAVRMHLPLVQVPGEAEWGYPANAAFAVAESWLGEPLSTSDHPHDLFLRYLAAFGPATVSDFQTWSGLPKPDISSLRSRLVTFADEKGRELFDLPKAPRPDEDTPAPVRFLPDYDNLLLAHSDRSRVIADEHRKRIVKANLIVLAVFLVDGVVAGTWRFEKKQRLPTLEPFVKITKRVRDELMAEGERLAEFLTTPPSSKAARR
ncbi:MAG TPA: winged helix DNA-binding domain-containing protein [Thermoanaerobaculia bacterium]|nr:winged helix DNA-binding domain-containing protein [Thermoanaerobaculia bacterium]